MSRTPRIRLREVDKIEYNKMVRNTRAKINRVKKNHNIDLSNEIDILPLESFQTREQYNQFKEQVRSFTNRANLNYQFVRNKKYNFSVSKKQDNQMRRETKKAQRKARQEINKLKDLRFISGGKDQGQTVGEHYRMRKDVNPGGINVPADYDLNKIPSRGRFDKRLKNLTNKNKPDHYDERMETMQKNFQEIIKLSFDTKKADKVAKEIGKLSPEEFFMMYSSVDEIDFEEFDSEQEHVTANTGTLDQILNYIDDMKRNGIDKDLNGF